MSSDTTPETVAERLARAAETAGAQSYDVLAVASVTTGIGVRAGALEDVESSGGLDVGLRVLMDRRQAVVSGSDLSASALDALAERAVAMARVAPEDPYAGLAEAELLAGDPPDLDLADPEALSPDDLEARALACEAAALSVSGVVQAEGASASQTRSRFHLLTSEGFRGGWAGTRHTLGVSAYAQSDANMERDYDHHSRRFLDELPSPEAVGRLAGERAVARLGARQMESRTLSVLFERRVADSLLGAFLSAISGPSVARGTSFLKDRLGERIFPADMSIVDDPARPRALGSRPFDGEGVVARPLTLVENGVLRDWLLNTASARKLGLRTNGRARRGVGSPPGVGATNCWIPAGERSPDALRRAMGEGLQITEMFGPSLNANTGDYSVGVAGFAIRGGRIDHPVSEITVAGNLLDMFASLEPASDLVFDGAVVSPSLLVPALTVAGR